MRRHSSARSRRGVGRHAQNPLGHLGVRVVRLPGRPAASKSQRDTECAPPADAVEAPYQRDGERPSADDDARLRRVDASQPGQPQRQDFCAGDGTVVPDAGELADGQVPIVVEHRALRPEAPQRSAAAAEVAQVLLRLGAPLDSARGAEEVGELEQRRSPALAGLGGTDEAAFGIAQAQGPHPADVVNTQQVVQFDQCTRLRPVSPRSGALGGASRGLER